MSATGSSCAALELVGVGVLGATLVLGSTLATSVMNATVVSGPTLAMGADLLWVS